MLNEVRCKPRQRSVYSWQEINGDQWDYRVTAHRCVYVRAAGSASIAGSQSIL